MAYDIQLRLPEQWISEQSDYMDESGFEVSHLEAHLRNERRNADDAMIDIYVGDMPEGETAEDQAFANYAEVVGFDEDDPEDFNPISKCKFNGKNAWKFDALCEDESPMTFLSQEIHQGVLAIIVAAAVDNAALEKVMQLVERGLRVPKSSSDGKDIGAAEH